MKPLILALILLIPATASDIGKWTEEATKRVIDGEIVDRKTDGSAVKVITVDDRSVWIETAKLIKADRDFIQKWVSPAGRLSARVVASGKGWKEIKVTYQSGASPLSVHAHNVWYRKGPIKRKIKAGETGEFIYRAHNEYRVIA